MTFDSRINRAQHVAQDGQGAHPTRQARYPSYYRRRSSVNLTLLAAGQTVESVEGYGPTLRVGRTGSEVALAA